METNNKEKMVEFKELTETEKQMIDELIGECTFILIDALSRVSKVIEDVSQKLFKEENK